MQDCCVTLQENPLEISFPGAGADINDTMMTDEDWDLRSTAGLLLDSIICFKFHSPPNAHHNNHIWGPIVKSLPVHHTPHITSKWEIFFCIAFQFKRRALDLKIHPVKSIYHIFSCFCILVSLISLSLLWRSDEMQASAMMPSMISPGDIFRAAQVLNMSPGVITAPESHTNDANAGNSWQDDKYWNGEFYEQLVN